MNIRKEFLIINLTIQTKDRSIDKISRKIIYVNKNS
jgi:hypothetical protein